MTKKELVDQLDRCPDDTQIHFVFKYDDAYWGVTEDWYFDINNKIEIRYINEKKVSRWFYGWDKPYKKEAFEGATCHVILKEEPDDE